jgi:hypothetical protein
MYDMCNKWTWKLMRYVNSEGAPSENTCLRNRSKAFVILLTFHTKIRSASALCLEAKRTKLRGELCSASNRCCAWCWVSQNTSASRQPVTTAQSKVHSYCARSEVLAAVVIKDSKVWDITITIIFKGFHLLSSSYISSQTISRDMNRIARVPDEARTEFHLNTILERYHYPNPLANNDYEQRYPQFIKRSH